MRKAEETNIFKDKKYKENILDDELKVNLNGNFKNEKAKNSTKSKKYLFLHILRLF